MKLKDHLGYLGGECVTGWIEQMDYEVQYWEICEHDNGTSLFVKVDHSVTSTQEGCPVNQCFSTAGTRPVTGP